ncbi:recombination protein NinG [Pseudomonas syringae]|uniref:recombination protein NinG n=1 Tax=Pseudomonas syringae TaxID=317 RepID=UPI0016595F31|nr:recombination protein NinG [Pseudomonas syringae]MBC9743266.1 recombination protein NinG [Pseudomonas syringae pv. syringae]MBC9747277.1 recombination protein NinG [Pseudomonas syringae pv. syringae]MCK9691346.1 recombination protein NinG [Pseudomonas syringae pv. syringae]MCK9720936.1 recombination protein NinG [Pseudomonas syringae pv. syringae]
MRVSLQSKTPKAKKCRVPECGASFVPRKLGQAVCSPACAIIDAPRNQAKARKALAQVERSEIKARKEKLKPRSDHMRDTQTAFNAWIRERDAGQPCISCGTTADVQMCAGHFRTVGSCPELRFEPLNVHLQCNRNCNMGKSGNLLGYRPGLLAKIGAEALAWVEGPHEPQKYTIQELKALTAKYRALTRELKKGQAA